MSEIHAVEVAAVLRELTAQLIASDDLDDALRRLATTAADLVDGPSWCVVTLLRTGDACTAAASPGLPADVDDGQYRTGDGPGMAAIRTREMISVPDLAADGRWAGWRRRALAADIRGVLAVPVDVDDHVIGAVSLYAGRADAFTPDVNLTALMVADHAGLLLGAVLDRGRRAGLAAELAADLADALGAGETVNRAVGIVMAQRTCAAETALDVLRQTAMRLDLPLSAVADRLVTTITARASSG